MVAVTLRGPFQQWSLERQGLIDTINRLESTIRELRETATTQKNQLLEYQKLLANRESVITSEMNKSRGLEATLLEQAKDAVEARRLATAELESARETVEEFKKTAATAEAAVEEAKRRADAAMAERDAAFYDMSSTEKETRVLCLRLDKAEASVGRLSEENAKLRGDLEAMTRSRDNHSRHNCVLLKEKARQGDLIAALKRELARPEIRIAAARAARDHRSPPPAALTPARCAGCGAAASSHVACARLGDEPAWPSPDTGENSAGSCACSLDTHGRGRGGPPARADESDSWGRASPDGCRNVLADLAMNGSTPRSSKQHMLDAAKEQHTAMRAQVAALRRENAELVVRFRGANEARKHAQKKVALLEAQMGTVALC